MHLKCPICPVPCVVKQHDAALCCLQEDGSDISPWHDLPLYNTDGTLTFVCEISKDTTAKFEIATVSLPVLSRKAH